MISPCAATENATASAFGTPLTIRIAAPAPACVAAPAGAIGSAADAAEAQRNAIATDIEAPFPIERACRRTNSAMPRRSHETVTSAQAFEASRGQAQWSCTQRATLKRTS